MKLHILKIRDNFYWEVSHGFKKAEIRKNDRDYEKFDLIHFVDMNGEDFIYCPDNIFMITHVLKDIPQYGLNKDYVILSIEKLGSFQNDCSYL